MDFFCVFTASSAAADECVKEDIGLPQSCGYSVAVDAGIVTKKVKDRPASANFCRDPILYLQSV